MLAQRHKRLQLPEKPGDVDQQVAVKLVQFFRLPPDETQVVLQLFDLVNGHAPPDAPVQRGVLVVGEIHSRRFPQQPEQRVQVAAHHSLKSFRRRRHDSGHVGMLADSAQLPGDVPGRQDKVDAPRVHRIARHAVVFRRLILGKRDSPRALYGAASFGAVRRRARQDDADGLLPSALGE